MRLAPSFPLLLRRRRPGLSFGQPLRFRAADLLGGSSAAGRQAYEIAWARRPGSTFDLWSGPSPKPLNHLDFLREIYVRAQAQQNNKLTRLRRPGSRTVPATYGRDLPRSPSLASINSNLVAAAQKEKPHTAAPRTKDPRE